MELMDTIDVDCFFRRLANMAPGKLLLTRQVGADLFVQVLSAGDGECPPGIIGHSLVAGVSHRRPAEIGGPLYKYGQYAGEGEPWMVLSRGQRPSGTVAIDHTGGMPFSFYERPKIPARARGSVSALGWRVGRI